MMMMTLKVEQSELQRTRMMMMMRWRCALRYHESLRRPKGGVSNDVLVFARMWRPRSRKQMMMIDAFALPADQLPVSSPVSRGRRTERKTFKKFQHGH